MDKKTLILGLTLLTARLAGAAPQTLNPVTIPAARSAAAAVVQQYLAARDAGRYATAYALLSRATQGTLPLGQFETNNKFPKDPTADGMTPLLSALSAFFIDTHNSLGYRYFVLGALPDAPDTVLVRVRPPATSAVFFLKVVTTPGTTGGQPRLDLMQSMTRTDAGGVDGARQWAQEITSVSNLRQIVLGILQYAQDHNNTFPDADRWIDETMPYVKNEALFHDPSAPAGEQWSYAYNRNLSGVHLTQLDSPALTVIVFESTSGIKNASDVGTSVPRPGRHQGGTDYAFADGRTRWLPDGKKASYLLSGQ